MPAGRARHRCPRAARDTVFDIDAHAPRSTSMPTGRAALEICSAKTDQAASLSFSLDVFSRTTRRGCGNHHRRSPETRSASRCKRSRSIELRDASRPQIVDENARHERKNLRGTTSHA
jgi:hypothetical protein